MTNKTFGLSIGTKASNFETVNIESNEISLGDLLSKHRGVLLDFFRGQW